MPHAKTPHDVHVTVVGAGIAGLTAAQRLSQRGYKVTVYEKDPEIGGNLRILFPHMLLNWYNNFWRLCEDLGLTRERNFVPVNSAKFLRKGQFPDYMQWTNLGSVRSVWPNLLSGVAPIPDLFLGSYSIIDLLTQKFDTSKILGRRTVNDFYSSRPYATNRMAQLHDDFLETVWSLHSYLTSVSSYQDFVKYSFRHPEPQLWRFKADAKEDLLKRLEAQIGPTNIKKDMTVTELVLDQKGNAFEIKVRPSNDPDATPTPGEHFDYLILAVPPNWLAYLAMGPLVTAATGPAPQSIVTLLPEVSELRRLRSEPIPALLVAFNRALSDIPEEYVALLGSKYSLTFVKVPHPDRQQSGYTALVVAASDFYALPESITRRGGLRMAASLDGYAILTELQNYIPFDPGRRWGDTNSDIDYQNSRFDDGTNHELYVDEVGSEQWTVDATYRQIPNIFFAGDFCKTSISITTVEAGVMSGLKAASALWTKEPLGEKIEIIEPDSYPLSAMVALKLLMTPAACAAKLWSKAYDAATEPLGGLSKQRRFSPTDLLWAPWVLAGDWWKTMWSIYSETLSRR